MSLKIYSLLFKITAVGNMLAALIACISIRSNLDLFYGDVEINHLISFYHYGFWAFVFLLGVTYWYLATEPFRYRIIALVGGLGKLFVAGEFILLAINGHAKPLTLFGIAYDGFFGIVMLLFFFTAKEGESAS
jgi:hypothetical protein